MFTPNIIPSKHAEHNQIDAKWKWKKIISVVMADALKRAELLQLLKHIWNRKFDFFQCNIDFYFTEWAPKAIFFHEWRFTHEHQNVYFTHGYATREYIAFGVHLVK